MDNNTKCNCWTEWVNAPASYDENCPECAGTGEVKNG